MTAKQVDMPATEPVWLTAVPDDLEPPHTDCRVDLARAVLGAVLVADAKHQAAAIRLVPPIADPLLEWARQALLAAVEQGRPLIPAVIVVAARRARVEAPPALHADDVGFLHDLERAQVMPTTLPVLLDELAEAELRHAIAAHGRRLAAGAHRGFLPEQLALLELVGPLIDRCKRLLAASR